MSMPQYLTVAVISGKLHLNAEHNFGGEKASVVAALLKGKDGENKLSPEFLPIAFGKCRLSLVQFGLSKGFIIHPNPAYPRLVNPKEINTILSAN
jgi:hypothetical protein